MGDGPFQLRKVYFGVGAQGLVQGRLRLGSPFGVTGEAGPEATIRGYWPTNMDTESGALSGLGVSASYARLWGGHALVGDIAGQTTDRFKLAFHILTLDAKVDIPIGLSYLQTNNADGTTEHGGEVDIGVLYRFGSPFAGDQGLIPFIGGNVLLGNMDGDGRWEVLHLGIGLTAGFDFGFF